MNERKINNELAWEVGSSLSASTSYLWDLEQVTFSSWALVSVCK